MLESGRTCEMPWHTCTKEPCPHIYTTYTAHVNEANKSVHTWKLSRHTDKCMRASHVTRVIRQVAQPNTQRHGHAFVTSRIVEKKQCPCRIYDKGPSKDTWCINTIQRIRRETYGRCLNVKTKLNRDFSPISEKEQWEFSEGLASSSSFLE